MRLFRHLLNVRMLARSCSIHEFYGETTQRIRVAKRLYDIAIAYDYTVEPLLI